MTRLSGLTASGTTEITSSAVDGKYGDRHVLTIAWGTIAGAQTVEFDLSNDGSTWVTVKGDDGNTQSVAVSTGSAGKYSQFEFAQLNMRYLRCRIPRANASQVLCITGETFNERVDPVASDDSPVRLVQVFSNVRLPNGYRVATTL